jgi:hypothetical protein
MQSDWTIPNHPPPPDASQAVMIGTVNLRRLCILAIYCSICLGGSSFADQRESLLPVPKSAPQNHADFLLRKSHSNEFAGARRDPEAQLALARLLRKEAHDIDATENADRAALKFVMLRDAREYAIDCRNLRLAMYCVDDLSRAYRIDPLDMKLSALAVAMDKASGTPAELAEAYLQVVEDFLDSGDLGSAHRAMTLVHDCLRKDPSNAELRRSAAEHDKMAANANRARMQDIAAEKKLKSAPDDPQLNFDLGAFLCSTGQWKAGLPRVARLKDSMLSVLARNDLENPNDVRGMLFVANDWWKYEGDAVVRQSQAKKRAAFWYEKALPLLNGSDKEMAQERVHEILGDDEP